MSSILPGHPRFHCGNPPPGSGVPLIVDSQTKSANAVPNVMAEERRIPEHIARLLTSSIETVERLDVLLHLRANKGKLFGARAVAQALHMSTAVAEQHLAILCGRGFLTVSIGSDLIYGYQPVSSAIDVAMQEVADLSRDRRPDVLATLRDASDRDPVHAFANAFLIRKTDKKGG